MKLEHVVPIMEKAFGILEYAGKKEEVMGRNGNRKQLAYRNYHLYSEKQPADDIEVLIPAAVAEKNFGYEDKVMLVNPRIEAKGEKIGDSGHTSYVMYADDMKKIV